MVNGRQNAFGTLAWFFGVGLLYIGMGTAVGYFAYEVAKSFISSFVFDALFGVIFFTVGLVLMNKIFELVDTFMPD